MDDHLTEMTRKLKANDEFALKMARDISILKSTVLLLAGELLRRGPLAEGLEKELADRFDALGMRAKKQPEQSNDG